MHDNSLVACHECDLLHRAPRVRERAVVRCSRCNAVLFRCNPRGLDRTLALAVASAILFVLANWFPLFQMESQGIESQTTVISATQELYRQGDDLIAAIVMLTAVVVPLCQLVVLLYVLVPIKLSRVPPGAPWVLRMLGALQPWGMLEVFLLGALVSAAKLAGMANTSPGIALWALGALIVTWASTNTSLDLRSLWQRIGAR